MDTPTGSKFLCTGAQIDNRQTVIPKEEAQRRLQRYVEECQFPGPSNSDQLVGDLAVHAIALGEDGSPIEILHTDAGRS